jgi:hypothetical protein
MTKEGAGDGAEGGENDVVLCRELLLVMEAVSLGGAASL